MQIEILSDLREIEEEMGNPTFTWKGKPYCFIPSVVEFNRDLDKGGFNIVMLMTATIRRFDVVEDKDGDINLVDIFNGVFLTPQKDIITYSVDGLNYRIESIKPDPTQSYYRITAHSTAKFK